MPPRIQNLSPSTVIRCLLPQPYGTYIIRSKTINDEYISLISINNNTKEDIPTDNYVILSIRVDETIHKYYIEYFRIPYIDENIQNIVEILDMYNKQKFKLSHRKLTPLTRELIVDCEDKSFLFDKNQLQGTEFSVKEGLNNSGVSTALWKFEKQHEVKVFIKRFAKNTLSFKHELSLLKEMCYLPIVTFFGQYYDNDYSYLVFEYSGQSLESYKPIQFEKPRLIMKFISNVGFQVATAMMYLETKNIVHRDLTAGNVLINDYGFIRVADFGHAIKKEANTNTLEPATTAAGVKRFQFRFQPPECLPFPRDIRIKQTQKNLSSETFYPKFSSKSDVWSFGILLTQLMLPNPSNPYPQIEGPDEITIPKYVKIEKKIHSQPKVCHVDMYYMLQRCWAYEAKDRISFSEIRDKMEQLEKIFQ